MSSGVRGGRIGVLALEWHKSHLARDGVAATCVLRKDWPGRVSSATVNGDHGSGSSHRFISGDGGAIDTKVEPAVVVLTTDWFRVTLGPTAVYKVGGPSALIASRHHTARSLLLYLAIDGSETTDGDLSRGSGVGRFLLRWPPLRRETDLGGPSARIGTGGPVTDRGMRRCLTGHVCGD